MLEGTITYRDTHGRRNVFNVEGIDNSVTLSLTMESYDYDTMLTMESEGREDFGRALSERRVDVGISNIKVSTALSTNEEGKKVKEPVNADLFCRLGALLRYVKSNCSTRNELGYTGLSLASGEFEQCEEKEYEIKFPTDESKTLATVTLCYDSIAKLQVNTDIFDISLEDNNPKYVKLFPTIKNGWTSGLRFNEESLGFKQKEKVIKDSLSSEGANYINDGLYHSIEEIIEANPDKEFSWLLGKDYRIVTDETLDEVFNYIMEDRWEYVYYDTETTGLNINFKSRTGQADQLVGVVLSVKFGESFFFPTQMNSIVNLCGGDHFYFMQKYMKPILERKKLVAHNAPFDWKVGYIYDINCNIVHDTMAILHLTLGAERKNYKVGLKSNAKLLLGRDSLELSDLVRDNSWGENSDITFADLPEELVRLYACADTDNTNGLLMYAEQADLLAKYNAKKIYEIELAFGFAVAYQEFYGHRIDITNLEKVRADLGEEQKKLLQTMFDICGHEFNPNSPKQLQTVLYEELGIPKQYSRKTGNVTTDGKTLEKLASITDINDEVKYPFCRYLLQYRQLEGVRKTVDKFPEHMTSDGYIFSDVQQYGTTTGRVSIKNPNYQSYNDPIKKNVIPRPGFWMFDTDYSSVEYRVLGNMVGNKRIMESFKDPDFDYHAYQAARMNGVPYSAVTKKMRKAAKGINFGLPYGMGDASLGVQIFGEESAENTRKAGALRTAYFKGQEDIRDWFEYHRDRGVNEGFTETYFGRRRYYHKSDFSVSAIRRQAGNQVIQGTAADIYKTAVGRVFNRICKEGWLGKVMFTGFIHDELLGEVSNDINPAVFLKVLREEFEVKVKNDDGSDWCPLYMGFGYGMNWYEAKSVELPIKLQWEIVEKYGDNGFPEWDGDGRKFCDTVPDKLRDFEVRDIRNQMISPEAQGKEIKVTLNNQILGCVKEDAKEYSNAISDYITESGDYAMIQSEKMQMSDYLDMTHDVICKYLDKHIHIQDLYKDENGNYVDTFEPAKTTQDAITQYCMLHGVDRSSINLLDIEEVDTSARSASDVEGYLDYSDEEEADSEAKRQALIDSRVFNLGLYLDVENKEIYLRYVPTAYMNLIRQYSNKEQKGYRIYFKDFENNKLYKCDAWLESANIHTVQDIYLSYFKNLT